MKITQDTLEVSTVKIDADSATSFTPPIEVKYNKATVTPYRGDDAKIYQPEVQEYAAKIGANIASNLKAALELRSQGSFSLTMRELDCIARDDCMCETLKALLLDARAGYIIWEGSIGEADCLYILRSHYNRGLTWRKEKRNGASPEQQAVGDKALIDLTNKMVAMGYPPWNGEIDNGFPVEFTKPEFMSWEQYKKACDNEKRTQALIKLNEQESRDIVGQPRKPIQTPAEIKEESDGIVRKKFRKISRR